MKKEFIFVDHLKEHMKRLVTNYVKDHEDTFPHEFANIPIEKLIELITDQATPVLRKIEGEALDAGIELIASLIRYSQKRQPVK
jgi:hypothetical protein